jgi:hypothetical protein
MMTTNTMIRLAGVLGLGLASTAVGYARPKAPSTADHPCGPITSDCNWEVCNQGADKYECWDLVPTPAT